MVERTRDSDRAGGDRIGMRRIERIRCQRTNERATGSIGDDGASIDGGADFSDERRRLRDIH